MSVEFIVFIKSGKISPTMSWIFIFIFCHLLPLYTYIKPIWIFLETHWCSSHFVKFFSFLFFLSVLDFYTLYWCFGSFSVSFMFSLLTIWKIIKIVALISYSDILSLYQFSFGFTHWCRLCFSVLYLSGHIWLPGLVNISLFR